MLAIAGSAQAADQTRWNDTLIAIPDSGAASPYPSNIVVSHVPSSGVAHISVSLLQFRHTNPADVDVLLQNPAGKTVVLMSDAGGSTNANGVDLIFEDDAPSFLPSSGGVSFGIYKPTNYGASDTFASPAPAGPYGSSLATLYGDDPVGTWKLFVVDDTAGNTGEYTAGWSLTFGYETTPPDTGITSGPSGPTNNPAPSFTFTASEPASFRCSMDGALPLSYCTSPYTSPTLPDGTHTFYVTAVDGSGNQDPIPAYQTFTVDTQPPETTIGSGPLGNTISRTASFAFAASEPGPGFSCSLDGAAFAACVSPASYSGLKLGAHTFSVRATDAAGNVDASPAARAWTVVAPCVVPNVRGKTLSSARRSITAAHCAVGKVTKAYSTKVKSGLVISQSPAAKKTLSPGAKVNLVVSRGRRRR